MKRNLDLHNTEIVNLINYNFEEISNIFLQCFRHDPYYIDRYGEKIENIIVQQFIPIIKNIITLGDSYGVIDEREKLIAIVVCFKYNKIKASNKPLFNSIFMENNELPYKEQIHDRIDKLKGETLYVIDIAVLKDFRRKGTASFLIDYIINTYKDFNIVGDVSNEKSLPIYKKRNFLICKLDKEYYIISKRIE